MFALKALVMSLLNVARAGTWRRKWWVTAIRGVVAFVPAAGLLWGLDRLITGIDSESQLAGGAFASLMIPVALYLMLGGAIVDHIVGRIGALMTWVVHLVWGLIVVLALAVTWVGIAAMTSLDDTQAFGTASVALVWSLPYITVAFLLARLVPGSFPKPKPWHENVRDVKAAYRRLRGRRAARRDPATPRAVMPPVREKRVREKRVRRKDKLPGIAEAPPRELPPEAEPRA